MEAKKLNVQDRVQTRKAAAGRLRREGKIPAVIYGYVESPLNITVDEREFRLNFKRITENTIIELTLPSGTHEVLVKDYQRDNITGQILHIDFYEFKRGVALRTRVPVRMTGSPVGVREGGVLETLMHQIEVECLPKALPEEILGDISELKIGDALHIRQLPIPEGVKVLNNPEQVVCLVTHKMAEEEVAPAVAAVEGEVPVEGEEGAVAAEEGKEEAAEPEEKEKKEKEKKEKK
jgi:large subunit ribosomal protein L25